MTRLVTQLVADDPAIVLVGKNTVLKKKIAEYLQNKKMQVISVDPKDLEKKSKELSGAYKIVWVHDEKHGQDYLQVISVLKDIKTPLVVIAPLITALESYSSDLLDEWHEKSQRQLQFIVDSNYYLPKAGFLFGQDVIADGSDGTSLEFITKNIPKKVLIDHGHDFHFVSMDDFVNAIDEFIFRPGKQSSVLIRGKKTGGTQFIGLIKKLYDSYHNTSVEVMRDQVELAELIPFSLKEKTINQDSRTIATSIVKNLNPPSKVVVKKHINKPNSISKQVVKKQELTEKEFQKKFVVKKEYERGLIHLPVADIQVKEVTRTISEVKVKTEKQPVVVETTQVKVVRKEDLIDVNQEIQRIFSDSRTEKKVDRVQKIVKTSKKTKKKSKRKRVLFYGGMASVGISIGIIVLAVFFISSQFILKRNLVAAFSNNKSGQVEVNYGLKTLTSLLDIQTQSYGSFLENNSISNATTLVEISKQLQLMPMTISEADEATKNLVLQILTGDITETSELAQILGNKVQAAYENFSLVQASLKQVEFGDKSNQTSQTIERYEKQIAEMRSGMVIYQQLQQVLPSLSGQQGKRTYAVLLQNNQELRPTGGFIQAVALLNFDNGSLVSHKVYSVYDLDKRLSGEVIPPDEIIKYLGEEKWYLRDSNWNPDFPETADKVAWFLSKIMGVEVDGVAAINLYTIQDILKTVGPLDLAEYNEVINHKNILERMEFHSEVLLVEDPNTIEYSVKIFDKTLENIKNIEKENIPALLSALRGSFEDKQLMFSVSQESDESILHSLGWTGSMIKPQCPARLSVIDCTVDSFAQVEANIGVNKANYYLDRDIQHSISLDKDNAHHTRIITYENNSKSNAWPKGTYKSYQRFYINPESKLKGVKINGIDLVEQQINKEVDDEYQTFGIRVDVPIQSQTVIELSYSTPIAADSEFSYAFFNQKQSGTQGDSFMLSIDHKPNMKPVLIAPSAEVFGQTITFDTDNTDEKSLFGVMFD